jgi:CBS-domain-containing membrane protein
LNTDNNSEQNQIDFDKDIDEILKEIENDPELQIDEEEIEKILKEIEEETESELNEEQPAITVDPEAVKKAKEQFKK